MPSECAARDAVPSEVTMAVISIWPNDTHTLSNVTGVPTRTMSAQMALSKRNLSRMLMLQGNFLRNIARSSITPETTLAMAVAIAAPDTPIPAPHIWNVTPSTLISRGAYISRKFSTMFIRFVDTLKTSGVAVSPVQRSMLEHICIDVLAMYARHTIEI